MVKYRSGSPAAAGAFCRFARNIIPLTDFCCRIFSRIGKIFVFRHFLFYNAFAIAYDAVIGAVTRYSRCNKERKGGAFPIDRLYDALDAFSSCTGIPVTVYDTENRITREFNAEQKVCRLFPHFSQSEGCQGYLTFSMDESFALGEPYIFFCPAGFVKIAVPILYNGARRGCVLAGPLVLGSVDEKLLARIMELNPDDSALFPRVALFLQNAKESTPEQIQKIATLLYASVLSSRQNWEEYEHIRARSRGQISAGETVQQFKLSVSTGGRNARAAPARRSA